jgi:hypothetical protein
MSQDKHQPGRRSASAEAAALRRGNPEDDEPELPPRIEETEPRGPRRSASAEAAALRWQRDHPDEDD